MPTALLSYAPPGALAIALTLAAATDLSRREIDNALNLAIAALAPAAWLAAGLSGAQVLAQLLVAALTLALLAPLFAARAIGGGDVKLLAALALVIEPIAFARLVLLAALLGGPLSLACAARARLPHGAGVAAAPTQVPYGVAIAAAGLWVLAARYIPELARIWPGW